MVLFVSISPKMQNAKNLFKVSDNDMTLSVHMQ